MQCIILLVIKQSNHQSLVFGRRFSGEERCLEQQSTREWIVVVPLAAQAPRILASVLQMQIRTSTAWELLLGRRFRRTLETRCDSMFCWHFVAQHTEQGPREVPLG